LNTSIQQRLQAILLQSFSHPQLNFRDLPSFRQSFSQGLQSYTSIFNAIYMGGQAATPGMAFLAGYQNAIRCLDPNCPNELMAAFCVSEKGVKKPWDMASQVTKQEQGFQLNGNKGFVMLLPEELDRLYVVAKSEQAQLKCVFFSSDADGLQVMDSLKAPFIEDIPHSAVSFNQLEIPASQMMAIDGHQQANKPFRYWEDMHVALAMMAWMVREAIENGHSWQSLTNVTEQMCQLIEKFEEQADYYSNKSLDDLDKSHEILESHANMMAQSSQILWQKDRLLLQMGHKIRQLIRAKIAR
jgi:hypothetical protein